MYDIATITLLWITSVLPSYQWERFGFECFASTGVNTPEIIFRPAAVYIRVRLAVLHGLPIRGLATVTAPLVCVQGHATPQLVEEVQQEYHAVVRLVARIGWHERDNMFAVGRRIIAHRGREICNLFVEPDPRRL